MDYLGFAAGKIALICKEKNRIDIRAFSNFTGDVKQLYRNKTEIVTGLLTEEVLLRTLALKLKSKKEVLATLPFQVENLIPYPEDEMILLPTFYKAAGEVFLLASSKSAVKKHLAGLDFDSDRISCEPMALYRFARHFFKDVPSLFLHHENLFIAIENGRLRSAHAAEKAEAGRISAFLHKKYPKVDHFFSTSNVEGFSHFTKLELENEELGAFALPIGLALDGAYSDQESAQFRWGEHACKRANEKKKRLFTFFAAACLFFALCVTGLGHLHLMKRQRAVLEALHAPKGSSLAGYARELENKIYEKKKGQITVSTVPKVHEVLTWLSTHPALAKDCSISHVRYQMIKSPKLGTSARKFEAKVELELATENPRAARAFHEALLHDARMVDRKKGVKWTADHGVYHATFTLKEKRDG